MSIMNVEGLSVYYAGALALNNVDIVVNEGEKVGILGPNGAGKTTLMNTITGVLQWRAKARAEDITIEGKISYKGEEISSGMPYEGVKNGLIHCPEGRREFPQLTVEENLKIGGFVLENKKEVEENLDSVYELFPVLRERCNQQAGTLSGGERQMLVIGRALMSDPEVLCIDEPSLGLAPKLRNEVLERINEIAEGGVTILLAEQDVSSAFKVTERNYVLQSGEIKAEGTEDEIMESDQVKESYLGI